MFYDVMICRDFLLWKYEATVLDAGFVFTPAGSTVASKFKLPAPDPVWLDGNGQ